MCGICGEMRFDGDKPNQSKMHNMMDSIAKRGPDHRDEYRHGNIYLGHRRLSVIDISSKSNQPMMDAKSGRVIVFNGVIYNYKELRELLKKKFPLLSLFVESQRASIIGRLKKNSEPLAKNFFV